MSTQTKTERLTNEQKRERLVQLISDAVKQLGLPNVIQIGTAQGLKTLTPDNVCEKVRSLREFLQSADDALAPLDAEPEETASK